MNSKPSDPDTFSTEAILDATLPSGDPVLDQTLAALSSAPTAGELAQQTVAVDAMVKQVRKSAGATNGFLGRMTRRTGVMAAAGMIALTGVAAAAAGGPLSVMESLIDSGNDPSLVDVVDDSEDEVTADDSDVEDLSTDTPEGSDEQAEGLGHEPTAEFADPEETGLQDGLDEPDSVHHGAVVSAAAHSECGKDKSHDDEASGDEDETSIEEESVAPEESDDESQGLVFTDEQLDAMACAAARNHGEYVSAVARDKDHRNGHDDHENRGKGSNGKLGGSDDDESEDDESDDRASGDRKSADRNGPGKPDHARGKNKD